MEGLERQMDDLNLSISTSKRQTAIQLFLEAGKAEQDGKIGIAIDLYSRAFRLDPDVEHYLPQVETDDSKNTTSVTQPTLTKLIQPVNLGLFAQIVAKKSSHGLIEPETDHEYTLAILPKHVLLDILSWLGISSVACLERIAATCSYLYLLQRSSIIWRRLCQAAWINIDKHTSDQGDDAAFHLRLSFIYSSRLRTDGIYMCRIRYFRPGAVGETIHDIHAHHGHQHHHQHQQQRSTVNHQNMTSAGAGITFSAPVHLVTYYRYLRFWGLAEGFKCIMLITPEEPSKQIAEQLKVFPLNPSLCCKGMLLGTYHTSTADDEIKWTLRLHDPNHVHSAYTINSNMELHPVYIHAVPKSTVPANRPRHALTCISYMAQVTSRHCPSEMDSIQFDVSEWSRFNFVRVRSFD